MAKRKHYRDFNECYAQVAEATKELAAKGYLEDSGQRHFNPITGEFEIAWRISEKGIRHVERKFGKEGERRKGLIP